MGELQAEMELFEEKGASVLMISAGSSWSHRAFAADQGIEFPLIAGFNKQVIESYGVRREAGFPKRAYFIIDHEGIVRAKQVESSLRDQPEGDAVLEDLERVL
jgi:peroxiredoxin